MKIMKAGVLAKYETAGCTSFGTLLFAEKGKFRVRLGDAAYQVEAGEAFCILPGMPRERIGDWSSVSGGYILFEGAVPFAEGETLYPDESGKKILKSICFDGVGDAEMLFRHLHTALPEKGLKKRIRDYVKENLHTKLSLQSAAEDLGVSPLKLSAACKEAFGCGFAAYVSRERMCSAKHLLQNKTLNISDITKRLGFTSVQYFSICFKKETGLSPSDYRKYIK